jgi:hypothetical protein
MLPVLSLAPKQLCAGEKNHDLLVSTEQDRKKKKTARSQPDICIVLSCLFCGAGNGSQGLTYVMQVLYH